MRAHGLGAHTPLPHAAHSLSLECPSQRNRHLSRRLAAERAREARKSVVCFRRAGTWFKVRQRPVFWPSGRVPSTLRARQCSPTTAPSGAGSAVPFFPGAPGVRCSRTPEGPPTKREVSSRGTAAREDTVVLSNKAS